MKGMSPIFISGFVFGIALSAETYFVLLFGIAVVMALIGIYLELLEN